MIDYTSRYLADLAGRYEIEDYSLTTPGGIGIITIAPFNQNRVALFVDTTGFVPHTFGMRSNSGGVLPFPVLTLNAPDFWYTITTHYSLVQQEIIIVDPGIPTPLISYGVIRR